MKNHIDNFPELLKILENPFVLFCGSAISGGYYEKGNKKIFLPMAYDLYDYFFKEIHRIGKNRTYLSKVLSKYALSMVKGKYSKGTLNIKFEDFIWRMQSVLGESEISKFLWNVYSCDRKQFLHNHYAISRFFQNGLLNYVLTTNFDNAIENLDPEINVIDFPSTNKSLQFNNPTSLVKLHGDVNTGSYVATTPRLLSAEQMDLYSNLQSFLSGKNVLVAGYSGRGDIDISPHLYKAKENGARFIWLVKPQENDEDICDIATDWYATDLFSTDPKDNCLLKIAGMKKRMNIKEENMPNWRGRMSQWIGRIYSDEKILGIIDECLEGIVGWAKVHIYSLGELSAVKKPGVENNQHLKKIYFSDRCLKIGTYLSALNKLKEVDEDELAEVKYMEEYKMNKGFCFWRLMRIPESLKTLEYFVIQKLKKKRTVVFEVGLRVFLEVARDHMVFLRKIDDIKCFYKEYRIETICSKLEKIVETTIDPASQIHAQNVLLDIKRLIRKEVTIDDYKEIFQRAIDLKLWAPAESTALSIWRMNPKEGRRLVRFIREKSTLKYNWHSLKEIQLARIERIKWFPIKYLRLVIAKLSVLYRECALLIKKRIWWMMYKSSIVIYE